MTKGGTMKRTETKFVPKATMLRHLAEGWRLANPPEVMEGGGDTRFLIVRDLPAPVLLRAFGVMARAARTAFGGAGA